MKNKNSIAPVLILMLTIFSQSYGMEQSIIGSQSSPQKIKNAGSFIRKAMNEDLMNKTTHHKIPVYEKINELSRIKVLPPKQRYNYDQESKMYIMTQFFMKYPKQLCPELQVIADELNDPLNHKDFITLLPKLKKSYGNVLYNDAIDDLAKIIQKKKDAYTDNEIEAVKNCLKIICSPQTQKYKTAIEELKKVIASEKTTSKLRIGRKNILQSQEEKKEANLDDLITYKKELETRMVHLKEPKTFKEKAQKRKDQERIEALSQRINLLTDIDNQLLQDYSENSLQKNEELFINLLNLKKELNKPNFPRDEKLNKKLTELSQFITKAIEEEIAKTSSSVTIGELFAAIEKLRNLREFPIKLEKREAELPENLRNLDKTLYDPITDNIEELLNQVDRKREEDKLEQERKEQELLEAVQRAEEQRIEQQRLAKERLEQEILAEEQQRQVELQRQKQEAEERKSRIKKQIDEKLEEIAAKQKQDQEQRQAELNRVERAASERKLAEFITSYEDELNKIKEERLESLEQKRAANINPLIPLWITNGFSQVRQNITNFVSAITTTITSWWGGIKSFFFR